MLLLPTVISLSSPWMILEYEFCHALNTGIEKLSWYEYMDAALQRVN